MSSFRIDIRSGKLFQEFLSIPGKLKKENKATFFNMHYFVTNISLTVSSVVFEKYLENWATFGRAIVREIRHVLIKFACVDNFRDAII